MSRRTVIKKHEYYDSVRLMQAAEKLRRVAGVKEAMLMMATDNNKRLLEITGLLTAEMTSATANDLIIAIVADSDAAADGAQRQAEQLLKERVAVSTDLRYRSLESARAAVPDSNLALISIPGQYAAAEARRALEQELHVMLFSDQVSIEDEVALKRLAHEKGLLLMGPDCGTAIIHGVGLGFANVVRRGPVGLIGASGTGIQAISSLLDRQGVGISHAIGTGGRDLTAAVGGITMLDAIDWLEADSATELLVLTSKPPDAEVSRVILERVARCRKPVVVNFLGAPPAAVLAVGATPAATLEEAATAAVRLIRGGDAGLPDSATFIEQIAATEAAKLTPSQQFIRGLFAGGTLCYEAMLVLREQVGVVYSNIPLEPNFRLADPWRSQRHTFVDLGEDEFTLARAHPMIDSTLRVQRLLQEANDPTCAVILLDIVLGYGAEVDPAASLAGAIQEARAAAAAARRHLTVVASICGTDNDPQELRKQEETLRQAGAVLATSNAQAARLAGRIVQRAASE